jgi:hypothetical protein
MSAQLFEIFSGDPKKNPMWIGTARSKEEAEARMAKLAAEKPGKYFIWFGPTQEAVAEVDTTHG